MELYIATIIVLLIMSIVLLIRNFILKNDIEDLLIYIDDLKRELAVTKAERDLLKLKEDSSYELDGIDDGIENLIKKLVEEEE